MRSSYYALLNHPKWKKKRAEILHKCHNECTNCGSREKLNVHHNWYLKDKNPWEYSDFQLTVLCDKCHKDIHKQRDRLLQLLSMMPCSTTIAGIVSLLESELITDCGTLTAITEIEKHDPKLRCFSKLLNNVVNDTIRLLDIKEYNILNSKG